MIGLGLPVTYSSSNTSVATVNSTGFLLGVADGSTNIVVSSGYYSNTATYYASKIDQPLTSTDPNIGLGGSAAFTGTGTIDPVGSGWLRITSSTTQQAGYAYLKKPFSLNSDITIDFDFAMWGGNTGADGMGVFMADANVAQTVGAPGGSLGYCYSGASAVGMSGAYAGIMLDEWGGFCTACSTRPPSTPSGTCQNTVTIRGSVYGFGMILQAIFGASCNANAVFSGDGAAGLTLSSSSYPWYSPG